MCSLRRAKTKFVKSVGAKHGKKDNRQDNSSVDKEKRELIKDTFIPKKRQNLVRPILLTERVLRIATAS